MLTRSRLFDLWYWVVGVATAGAVSWPLLRWLVGVKLGSAASHLVDAGVHPVALVATSCTVSALIAGVVAKLCGPAWLAPGELLWLGSSKRVDLHDLVRRRSLIAQSLLVTLMTTVGLLWGALVPLPFGYRFAIAIGMALTSLVVVRLASTAQRLDVSELVSRWVSCLGVTCAAIFYATVAIPWARPQTILSTSVVTFVLAVVLAVVFAGSIVWLVTTMWRRSVFDYPAPEPPQWALLDAHRALSRMLVSVQALDLRFARAPGVAVSGKLLKDTSIRTFEGAVAHLAWRSWWSRSGLAWMVIGLPLPGALWYLWGPKAGIGSLAVVMYAVLNHGLRTWSAWLSSKASQQLFAGKRKTVNWWFFSPALLVVLPLILWALLMPQVDIALVVLLAAIAAGAWYRRFHVSSGRAKINYDVVASPAGALPVGQLQVMFAGVDVLAVGVFCLVTLFSYDYPRLVAAALVVSLGLAVGLSKSLSRRSS